MKEWIKVAACAVAAGVYVGALLAAATVWLPRCKPGDDPGVYIGGAMLVRGCPQLVCRNDGSVTSP